MARHQTFLGLLFLGASLHAEVTKPVKLPARSFTVCGQKLRLEVADNDETRRRGLMNRDGIPPGEGMLFVFATETILQFWMKNVGFDMDIGFFDSQGKLVNAMTMLASSPLVNDFSLPHYESSGAALFAIEVPKGFFSKHAKKGTCLLKPVPSAPRR